MSGVKALVGFGVGLIGAGFFWRLFNDIIAERFLGYIVSRNDYYFMANDFLWNALPVLVFILGVFCLIMAGMMYHAGGSVNME